MQSKTLEVVKKLVGFETTHSNEKEMAECLAFCADFFKEYRVIIRRYENKGVKSIVISTKDTLTPDVMFIGHIDMMPGSERQTPRIEKGRLYARGSFDMKAFVGTYLVAMKKVLDAGYKGNIAAAIVTDEELGGRFGTNYLVNTIGYRPKVVLDPDDGEALDCLISDTKHVFHLVFKARGVGSHAGTPWRGVNAVELLFKTFENLKVQFPAALNVPEHDWVNSINLGLISGGTATNEVPATATMSVDVRLVDTTRAQLQKWVEKSLVSGVTYEIDIEGYPTNINKDDPIIKKYIEATEKVIGKKVRFVKSTGASDGRYFAEKGILVITHQGGGGNCQTDDEYILIEDLDKLVSIYVQFIQENF